METNWFLAKVTYMKSAENGTQKKTTDQYLVDALNFTEAEARVTEEVAPFITGEFEVKDITRRRYVEIFTSSLDSDDKWWHCKVNFVTLDEKTMSEKRVGVLMLVQASGFRQALHNLEEGMKGTMADYEIQKIEESPILDVYGFRASEKEEGGDVQ